jgi:hypothetical protein
VTDGEAATPVPARPTVRGLPLPLSATESVPVAAPDAVGAKVTLIVQLLPAARVEELRGQLLVWAKGPAALMLVMVRAAVPVLENVRG